MSPLLSRWLWFWLLSFHTLLGAVVDGLQAWGNAVSRGCCRRSASVAAGADGGEECGYKSTTKITFVSSNAKKIREVQAILGDSFPWELSVRNFDLVEPQATPIEVSQFKCRQAAELLGSEGGAVIVEVRLAMGEGEGGKGARRRPFRNLVN
jgi:hypothetical protein